MIQCSAVWNANGAIQLPAREIGQEKKAVPLSISRDGSSFLTDWPLGDVVVIPLVIFKLIYGIDIMMVFLKIALRWMAQHLTTYHYISDNIFSIMAWLCQATSHFLSKSWPSFVTPYIVTRLQSARMKAANVGGISFMHALNFNLCGNVFFNKFYRGQ